MGITIKATNAFWDNERRAYVDSTFHLFDSVSLYKETADGQASLAFAFIKASDYLFNNSILKNSLLSLPFDSKFFHRLTPVEQRSSLVSQQGIPLPGGQQERTIRICQPDTA